MHTLTAPRSQMPADLTLSIFADRGRQFVDRLQWDLCVTPQGYEVDQYDDAESDYIVVHDRAAHCGSLRLRRFSATTMLRDHFSDIFPDAEPFLSLQRGRVVELTRFCRNPAMSVEESRVMLRHLAVALDAYRDANRLTGFVAVVFPQVARFLDTIGVRYLTLSKSRLGGKPVSLICITHAVCPKAKSAAKTQSKPTLVLVA